MGTTACTSQHCRLLDHVAATCNLQTLQAWISRADYYCLIAVACLLWTALRRQELTTRISAALKTVSPGSISLAGVWNE